MSSKKRSRSFVESDDDDPVGLSASKQKQIKTASSLSAKGSKTDDNGDPYWELKADDTRRVTVNEFKGKVMVNIREYYEKEGKKLPGKKGISLPADQFKLLVEALPHIERALHLKGYILPRPNYGDNDEEGPPKIAANGRTKLPPSEEQDEDSKANFEATSEED